MKKILALILTLALLCPCTALADGTKPVTATTGVVNVSYTSAAAEGTPASVVILPSGGKTQEEMATALSAATTAAALKELNLEYAQVINAGENGLIKLSNLKMKDGRQTGKCYVFIKFLKSPNTNEYKCVGEFNHLGVDDVRFLAEKFDDGNKDTFEEIVDGDFNGWRDEDGNREPAKEVLKNSLANVTYYTDPLTDKAAFHEVFYKLKGNTLFLTEPIQDTPMVKVWNDAVIWTRLCTDADTLSVLGEFNGTTEGKYWNIEIGETSDFATLVENEKSTILNNIKIEKYTKKEKLESDFEEDVVLALFRSLPQDREALEALIAADGKYASYFANARTIVENANLSTYDVTQLYNNVLAGCSLCTKFDAAESEGSVEKLFKDSIPTQSGSGGNDGDSEGDNVIDMGQGNSGISNGGSGGGGGGGIKKDPVKENEETEPSPSTASTPFADVSETHWANEYIAKLYNSGAINGVSETAFNPAGSVQRQDFVKILIGALGTKLSQNKSEFADVQSGAYYESYVMTALENGFISGTGDGSFGVGSNLKREDAAVIMARVLDSYGVKTLQLGKTFNDDAQVSDYAKDAIKKVSAIGIFGGDDLGNFNPKGSLTRAEACAILCRLADAVKEV
ncbi:MAG: S-layer homology domain-containing protein [Clostridia bacterium]|nr:S-layer homology domain-containing protein [Clostridia bacterium]